MSQQKKIEALFLLLTDENPNIAQTALGALLQYDGILDPYLAERQESNDPLLRKRVHQLQAILGLRRRRKEFARMLRSSNLDLMDNLLQVHLQWHDDDSMVNVIDLWQAMSDAASRFDLRNLENLAFFMQKYSFSTPVTDELPNPDYFCLGIVLEDRVGDDLMLCAIARELAAEHGLGLVIIRHYGIFCLADRSGRMLIPHNSWQVTAPLAPGDEVEIWDDPRKIAKYMISNIFLYAVGSDSFHYVYTIAHAMSGRSDNEKLDFLPYPYDGQERPGQSN